MLSKGFNNVTVRALVSNLEGVFQIRRHLVPNKSPSLKSIQLKLLALLRRSRFATNEWCGLGRCSSRTERQLFGVRCFHWLPDECQQLAVCR